MNKLVYVEKDRDVVVHLRQSEMDLDNIVKLVQNLFAQGVKYVGVETPNVKIYFDSNKDIGRQISGFFRDRIIKK